MTLRGSGRGFFNCRILRGRNLLLRFTALAAPVGLAWLILVSAVQAEVKLPAILSDHMVLQRDAQVPIWRMGGAGRAGCRELGGSNGHHKGRDRWPLASAV